MVSTHLDPRSQSHHGNGYSTDAEGFGQTLRPLREARHLSQSKLAERADFDHSYVSRLESGARQPTLDAVERLAKALGLAEPEAEALRMAAGFMPSQPERIYRNETVGRLDLVLANASPELCQWAEQTIEAMIGHLERARNHHD